MGWFPLRFKIEDKTRLNLPYFHVLNCICVIGYNIIQLLMFICTNMECTREDAEAVVSMLKAILSRLDLEREDVVEMVKRSERHEVHLMYLRFFNILMSRKKGKGEEAKVSGGVCTV